MGGYRSHVMVNEDVRDEEKRGKKLGQEIDRRLAASRYFAQENYHLLEIDHA